MRDYFAAAAVEASASDYIASAMAHFAGSHRRLLAWLLCRSRRVTHDFGSARRFNYDILLPGHIYYLQKALACSISCINIHEIFTRASAAMLVVKAVSTYILSLRFIALFTRFEMWRLIFSPREITARLEIKRRAMTSLLPHQRT